MVLCNSCFSAVNKYHFQAITKCKCLSCGIEMEFSTTDTDIFCEVCSKRKNICKKCGKNI